MAHLCVSLISDNDSKFIIFSVLIYANVKSGNTTFVNNLKAELV